MATDSVYADDDRLLGSAMDRNILELVEMALLLAKYAQDI